MKLSDWTVMTDTHGNHTLFYGDLEDFSETELEGYTPVPREYWRVEDMVEITSNLLEDVNLHRMCDVPNLVLECIQYAVGDEPSKVRSGIEFYMERIYELYGY